MLVQKAAFNAIKQNRRYFAEIAWVERRIGMFTMRISQLERIVDEMVQQKCGRSKLVGCTFAERVDALTLALKASNDISRQTRIENWHASMRQVIKSRNDIVHGFWGRLSMSAGEISLYPQYSDKKRGKSTSSRSVPMMDRKRLSQAVKAVDEMCFSMLRDSDLFR